MSNCLLCDQNMKNRTRFSDLIFFNKEKSGVCEDCFLTFEEIAEQHCTLCYKSGEPEICKDCQYWQSQGKTVDHAALYKYNEAMADYFSRYKFQGDYALRNVFAKKLRIALSQYTGYTVVPIPISTIREEERGFNQVEGLLTAANTSYQLLLGKHENQKQSLKNRKERLQIKGSFYLINENVVPEKILLVDDIYTTGATVQVAKDIIMKTGKKEIKTFSLAR